MKRKQNPNEDNFGDEEALNLEELRAYENYLDEEDLKDDEQTTRLITNELLMT